MKENPFMVLSIAVGVMSSCKAVFDAFYRALEAHGAFEKYKALASKDDGIPAAKRSEILGIVAYWQRRAKGLSPDQAAQVIQRHWKLRQQSKGTTRASKPEKSRRKKG